jgi:hypothetical protein
MFGRNNREANTTEVAAKPTIVMPSFGTGPGMLLKSLGLDPAELFQTFMGLESMLRGTVAEVLERSRVMDARMETNAESQLHTRGQIEAINARLDGIETRQAEQAANTKIILESLATLHRRQIANEKVSVPSSTKTKAKR